MTVAEYQSGVEQLERKLARIAELRAAIKAQRGEMNSADIAKFAFNDLRNQPADVTAVAPGPATVADAGLSRQRLGEEDYAAMTDPSLQPTMTGQPSHDVDEITAQVNRILARGQGGDVPAEATATRQVQTPEFESAMAPAQPNIGPVDKPVMESVDEAIKAGGAALAQSVTMGAITLSERDRKAIEDSPIAATIGSLIGDVPGVVGAIGAAKLTGVAFKKLAPTLIREWATGGEEVGRVLVNAAAREGLGGAYWSTLRQTVEETVGPEEERTWNERLTQLATDVGMFAAGGAAFEGIAAGVGRGRHTPSEPPSSAQPPLSRGESGRASTKEILETVSPVREAEAARAEAVGRPGPKSTEEALQPSPLTPLPEGEGKPLASAEQLQQLADKYPTVKRAKELGKHTPSEPPSSAQPPLSRGELPAAGESGGIEIAGESPEFKAKKFDYAAREVDGKATFGEVISDVDADGMVEFKPRKGKVQKVPAKELRDPMTVPRQRDNIEQVLEAAENQRRIAEETNLDSRLRGNDKSGDAGVSDIGKSKLAEQVEAVIDDAAPVGGPEVGTKVIRPVAQKVREVANKFEAEAKARITKRHKDAGGTAFDIGGATKLAAEELADYAIIGAAKIAKGAVEIAEFTRVMIEEYGERIKPFIEDIHKKAQEEFHGLRAKAVVDQHLEWFRQISVPQEFRPPRFERFKTIKQGIREGETGQKTRGAQLRHSLAEEELSDFTAEAWRAGAPVMTTKQGITLPVFGSQQQAVEVWNRAMAGAEKRYATMPKLSPARESAITQEARRRFIDEMVNMGVATRVKRGGVKLSPEIRRKGDLSLYIVLRNEMGPAKLKEALKGIPEGDTAARYMKMQEIAIGRGLIVPAVRGSGVHVPLDFASYNNFIDASEGIFGVNMGGTKRIDYIIRELDGKLSPEAASKIDYQAGPAERYVLWRYHDVAIQKMQWMADMSATAKRAIRGLSDEDGIKLTDVLEKLGSDDVDLSMQGLLARSEIRGITTDERILGAAVQVRKIYDEVLDQMNALRRERGQPEIPKREFYSPHSEEELSLIEQIMGKARHERGAGEDLPSFMVPNKPWVGFDLPRLIKEAEFPLERNQKKLLERYLNLAARDIFDTTIIQNNKAFIDYLRGLGRTKAADAIANWTAQSFAGTMHPLDNAIGMSRAVAEAMAKYRGALIRSAFPFNLAWTAIVQTSAVAPLVALYGPKNAMKGLARWISDADFRKEVGDQVYAYIIKSDKAGRISHQDFNRGMSRSVQLERSTFEKISDFGSIPSERVEQFLSGWAAATADARAAQLGLTGRKRIEYMSEAVAKVAGMFNREDVAGLVRSELYKTIFPFQSYVFEAMNVVREIAGATGSPPATVRQRLGQGLMFLGMVGAVNAIQTEAAGRRPWDISSLIPMYAALLDPDNPRKPIGPGQALLDAYAAAKKLYKSGDYDPLVKWALRYGTMAPAFVKGGEAIAGGTELARLYDGVMANIRDGKFDSKGKLLFPVTDTKDRIYSLLWGPWSTEGGREKAKDFNSAMIEFAPAESPVGKAAQTVTEALPIIGDAVEFRRSRKEDEAGIDITVRSTRRSSRRRSRPRGRY